MKSAHALVSLSCASLLAPLSALGAAELEVVTIPSLSDWTDYGWILEAGPEGAWDHHLGGMLTASSVRLGSTYALYYGGACCYSDFLDSVTFRAIGVATSPDGLRFQKHPQNPIVSWLPNNSPEEGATSSAVLAGEGGEILLYFGANRRETRTTVNADARLGVSPDGIHFENAGVVLDHRDNSVWGSGDEIFPILALEDEETWIVYYLTNGVPQQRHLGVAWGPARERLTHSTAVRSQGQLIPTWGVGGGAALIAPRTYAIFLNDIRVPRTEVRLLSPDSPDQLSAPTQSYQWDDVQQVTVLLDRDVSTWFLYYRNRQSDRYGVKLAAAGALDESPPGPPGAVEATVNGAGKVRLDWLPAVDPDTGVAHYRIYRQGGTAGATLQLFWVDEEASTSDRAAYEVSAVNFHGIEGARSRIELVEVEP